jgi:hypothetical protein
MVKLRRSLLVALALVGALIVNAWSVKSASAGSRQTVALAPRSSYTGPTLSGDPDSGQGKEAPKQGPTVHSGRTTGSPAYWGPTRWIRWTSGILMARYLKVVRF